MRALRILSFHFLYRKSNHLRYPLFIAKRIIFNTQPSFSRFIIRLAIAATILSVATMVITLCMVNGFQKAVGDKVYRFWGHARVQPVNPLQTAVTDDDGFSATDSIDQIIKANKGVTHFHAFAVKSVVLKTKGQFEGVLLKGVDNRFDEKGFSDFLRLGKMVSFEDSSYSRGIVLSEATAKRMELTVGDTLQCFFIRNGQDIRSRPVTVSGIFKTGMEEYDKNFAIADIRFLRKLNQWPDDRIGGYETFIDEKMNMDTVSAQIDKALPLQLTCQPISAIYPNIFDWLAIQNQTKRIVVITMLIVAIINLITCLLILVMERTRMVGVLKALGMPDGRLNAIFWIYAGYIAFVGVGVGLLLGLGLVGLQSATHFITMDEATYYVSYAPVAVNVWEVGLVTIGSFAVCLLAVRLPLFYVQRISPIRAIRFA